MRAGALVDLAATDNGATPLFGASQNGHIECTRLLLGAGAAVDLAATDSGATPLYMACLEGHVECMHLLLSAGATVDLASNGFTPLYLACFQGHGECAQLLSSYGARRELQHGPVADLAFSTHAGHAALTEWLARSRDWSPLHHLEVLSPERTRELLRGGADLHIKPSAGDDRTSPLERAQQLAPGSAAASLVVRAAGPWSAASHELFPDAERARAERLARSLYHVYLRRVEHGGWQAVDFARAVLPYLVRR